MIEDQYLIFKAIAGSILFIGPIIFAIIPFVLTRIKNRCLNEKFIMQLLDVLNGFAGGALMATGFIHLLPEAHEILTDSINRLNKVQNSHDHHFSDQIGSLHDHSHSVYPWAFLISSVSLVSIFFFEKILESLLFSLKTKKSIERISKVIEKEEIVRTNEIAKNLYDQIEEREQYHQNHTHEGHDHYNHDNHKNDPNDQHHSHDHHNHDADEFHSHIDTSLLNSGSSRRAALGGFILWLSLVSHSVFEGLALGSANYKQLWKLFSAIISHHLIASLALGSVLNQGIKNILISIFFIISYSLSIPFGMIIGIFVSTTQGEMLNIVQGASLALASGAFFFVSTFEILAHFNPRNLASLCFKIMLFLVGFVVMAVIANYA
eukprot:gene9367-1578_t